jgi:hypothetical protein
MAQKFEERKVGVKKQTTIATKAYQKQEAAAKAFFEREKKQKEEMQRYFKTFGQNTCKDSRCPKREALEPHKFDDHGECESCGSTSGKCFKEKCTRTMNKQSQEPHEHQAPKKDNPPEYYAEFGEATCTHTRCPMYIDCKPHTFDGHGECEKCGSNTGKCFAEKCKREPIDATQRYFATFGKDTCNNKLCTLFQQFIPHSFDGHDVCTNCGSNSGRCFAEKCTKKSALKREVDAIYRTQFGEYTCCDTRCPLFQNMKPHSFDGHGTCKNCKSTTGKCFVEKCLRPGPFAEQSKAQKAGNKKTKKNKDDEDDDENKEDKKEESKEVQLQRSSTVVKGVIKKTGGVNAWTSKTNKAEENKAEESKTEESKTEESKAEESKKDKKKKPSKEKKKSDECNAGESKTEESKAEESKAEESKAEESKAEESKAEESKAEESKAEESKAEESKAEESKAEESKTEEVVKKAPGAVKKATGMSKKDKKKATQQFNKPEVDAESTCSSNADSVESSSISIELSPEFLAQLPREVLIQLLRSQVKKTHQM